MPDDAPHAHTHAHLPELNMRPRQRRVGAAGHLDPALPDRLKDLLVHGKAAAAEPFWGVTADGTLRPGLFPLHRTGVSVAPLVAVADAFLAALTPTERHTASFPIDSGEWRTWSNIHPYLMRSPRSIRVTRTSIRSLCGTARTRRTRRRSRSIRCRSTSRRR